MLYDQEVRLPRTTLRYTDLLDIRNSVLYLQILGEV